MKAMRDYLDELSTELIASGAVTDPELAKIIASHAGQYMTRSYRIFGDAKCLEGSPERCQLHRPAGSGKVRGHHRQARDGRRRLHPGRLHDPRVRRPADDGMARSAVAGRTPGIDTRGRKKADIIADLDAAAQRAPSDEWIRQQLTDLLQKAKKAGSTSPRSAPAALKARWT